ncbi:DUF664 domain-containing protein [Pseudonocardia spinosispora]|uniref:mycothiol transferase n=1 Tax=Pseudonocardia spinosispora TaxID=103441 RepID=UPI00041EE676|nr:DUF664 domain-containing protein [Pseudonocardia spinosispora]
MFVGYLDYFRDQLLAKVCSLSDDDARLSTVPSGWAPIELLMHLRHVERRWLEWGFLGMDVGDPWADHRDDRWYVPADLPLTEVAEALRAQGARSRSIIEAHDLAEIGRPGPRWDGQPPASLERILFHLLQEYARHLGQLDVVTELAGGPVGE